jgi:hypothetical protein
MRYHEPDPLGQFLSQFEYSQHLVFELYTTAGTVRTRICKNISADFKFIETTQLDHRRTLLIELEADEVFADTIWLLTAQHPPVLPGPLSAPV